MGVRFAVRYENQRAVLQFFSHKLYERFSRRDMLELRELLGAFRRVSRRFTKNTE